MDKREKILIVLMAVAVFYGGYTFLTSGSEKRAPKEENADLTAFVADMSTRIGTSRLSEAEAYTIVSAAEPWTENPFLQGEGLDAMLAGAEEIETKKSETGDKGYEEPDTFVYSGYIQIAGLKLAIINGVEYEAGDKLEEEGYVLRKILPTKVILYNGKNEESYPLNEDK